MLISAFTMALAQHTVGTFTIQPRIGINISTVTDTYCDVEPQVRLAAGVEGEYQLTDMLSISAGLVFSRQGFKVKSYHENGYLVDSNGTPTTSDELRLTPSYLNIPIMANTYVLKGFAVKLGLQPEIAIDNDGDEELSTFSLSIPVGCSYELQSIPVVIDARYNWGITTVEDGYNLKEHQFHQKNSVFQITVGYKFKL